MKTKSQAVRRTPVPPFLSNMVRRALGGMAGVADQTAAARPYGGTVRRPSIALETMEPRLLLSADPSGTAFNAAGIYSVGFGGTNDVVGIHLVSATSANGGAIVDLTYFDNASVLQTRTLGTAAVGVTSLTVDGAGGDDSFTTDALGLPLTIHGGTGTGTDTLTGPNVDTQWTISGANAGFAGAANPFDGVEKLVAGNKIDTVDYSLYATGVTVNLAADTANATGFTSISGFENVIGSAFADTISGDGLANVLTGGGGANTLAGGGGTDTVFESGDLNFTLTGGSLAFGAPSICSPASSKPRSPVAVAPTRFNVKASTLTSSVTLIGGAGDDTYPFNSTQAGNFFLDETAGGTDTLDLSASTTNVEISLSKFDAQAISASLTLTLSAVSELLSRAAEAAIRSKKECITPELLQSVIGARTFA